MSSSTPAPRRVEQNLNLSESGYVLSRQLDQKRYETVEKISRILQPSHIEERIAAVDSEATANVLSFTNHLLDAQCEEIREIVLEEYNSLAAFRQAEKNLKAVCEAEGGPEELKQCREQLISYYLNVYIYHSAEHMLTMTRDAVLLAAAVTEEKELPAMEKEKLLKRVFIAGSYHDCGNGRFPREGLGADELDALRTFLQDVNKARSGDLDLQFLSDLEDEEVIQITADIMGTVFIDRHATREQLFERPYVEDARQIISDYGLVVEKEALADSMLSIEALVVKNADIAAALQSGKIIKNNFSVYYENLLKSEIFYGKSFADCRSGFISLLRGRLQEAIHGSESALSLEAAEGNLIVNPEGGIAAFNERNLQAPQAEAEFRLTLAYDSEIGEAMCRAIENNVRSGLGNILSRPMKEVGEDLRMIMGEDSYADYRLLFQERYADRSLIDLTQSEVNTVFQMKMREVEQILDWARTGELSGIEELAEAHAELNPSGWQARYIIETLRYFWNNRDDDRLVVKTLVAKPKPLISKGEKSINAYIVIGGEGRLVARGEQREELGAVSGVDIMGEMSVFNGGRRTADVFIEDGAVRLIPVPEEVVESISYAEELQKTLGDGIAVRLARGDVVTHMEDRELSHLFEKIFTFNILKEDPLFSADFQVALHREELLEVARSRGWELSKLTAGEKLITQGVEPEAVYVVIEGEALVYAEIEGALSCAAGASLGELSLVAPESKANADIVAGGEGLSVICVPRDLVKSCPQALKILQDKRAGMNALESSSLS